MIGGSLIVAGVAYVFDWRCSFFLPGALGTGLHPKLIVAALLVRTLQLLIHLCQRLFVPTLLSQQPILLRLQQCQRVWPEAILLTLLLVAELHMQLQG